MGRYYEIPIDTFDTLQLDAGILLKHFDIDAASSDPTTPGFVNSDIICATTGGVNPSCVPTFSDLGEDVDNCPVNMKELKKLESWESKISTTSLGTSGRLIKMSLGCADISEDGKAIIPRMDLSQDDFEDIWWVGDKANGGFVAIKLVNALSTGGFSLQTSKNGKGQTSLELTGHVSMAKQKEVPMKIYSVDPAETVVYSITNALTNVTSSNTATSVNAGAPFSTTLAADTGYEIDAVTVTMGGTDITATAYTEATGAVSIAEVTGNVVITATAKEI